MIDKSSCNKQNLLKAYTKAKYVKQTYLTKDQYMRESLVLDELIKALDNIISEKEFKEEYKNYTLELMRKYKV